MTKRDNHYEAAFESFLRERTVPYVAVDETRRSLLANGSLKSLDFIVAPQETCRWLVDIKGRRFPSGARKQFWKNWSSQDDLRSLAAWEQAFGAGFQGLFVFAYHVVGDRSPAPPEQLFRFRDAWYGFVGISRAVYAAHAYAISPKWETVAMGALTFRRYAVPFATILENPGPRHV